MKEIKVIWTLFLALTVAVNATMWTWKFTRRTAEDLQKINAITAEDVCERRNGVWIDGLSGCVDKK